MADNLNDAIRLLGVYTAGRFDIWQLAGSAKASCRQHVYSVLLNGTDGKNVPRAQCGVNAMREAFYSRIVGITHDGDCERNRETNFRDYCRGLLPVLNDHQRSLGLLPISA